MPEIKLFFFAELHSTFSLILWIFILLSASFVLCLGKESGIRWFVLAVIVRLIYSIGPQSTLSLLGVLTVNRI